MKPHLVATSLIRPPLQKFYYVLAKRLMEGAIASKVYVGWKEEEGKNQSILKGSLNYISAVKLLQSC